MTPSLPPLPQRAEIAPDRVRLLKKARSAGQPDTMLAEIEQIRASDDNSNSGAGDSETPTPPGRIVIKDMAGRPWLIRATWGRFVLRRERRALDRAAEIFERHAQTNPPDDADDRSGEAAVSFPLPTPRALGMIDADALAMEFIEGRQLPKKREDGVDEAFFDALASLLRTLHAAGLSHGDIRRTNIMITPEGRPALLDFASATIRSPHAWAVWNRLYFKLQASVDLHTFEKIRRVVLEGKEAAYAHYPFYMRVGRVFKKKVYGRLKRLREATFGKPDRSKENAEGGE